MKHSDLIALLDSTDTQEEVARSMLRDEISANIRRDFDSTWNDEKEIWLMNAKSAIEAIKRKMGDV